MKHKRNSIVNWGTIEPNLVDVEGMSKEALLELKKKSVDGILKAVKDRGDRTFAIQVDNDAPALSYQTHFWNFWDAVKELRVSFNVHHRSTGAVYE
jgi:hypothetical protein